MTTALTLQDRYKGVLNPAAVGKLFRLERYPAPPDLAPFIEWYWLVAWDLPPGVSHTQRTLPSPCVQVVFDRGRTAAFGVMTKAFNYTLSGRDHVLGARFRPGAFHGFLGHAVQTIADQELPLSSLFGCDQATAEQQVLDAADDAAMVLAASNIIRLALPADPAPHIARIGQIEKIMELIRSHPDLTQVGELAERAGMSVRALQQLFHDGVGASPKWVIRRNRLLDAADQLAHGADLDLATLAQTLGYYDQAHFTSDFEELVGKPPAHYRRSCLEE